MRDKVRSAGRILLLRIYVLRGPEGPWGAYSHILLHGMTAHLPRRDAKLQLERTGPFIPPVTFPGIGDVIVTDPVRRALEASGLSGASFRDVRKARIVELDWQSWERTEPDPPEYPNSGEPEDYILDRPHSRKLARDMGRLWELHLEEHADVLRPQPGVIDQDVKVVEGSWDGTDLFRGRGVNYVYGSDRAKSFLEAAVGEWVEFRLAQTEK